MDRTSPPMIAFEGVSKSYGDVSVLEDLDLAIRTKELVVLLGASGSGKTTALKLVNRLLEPSRGRVTIDGRSVADVPLAPLRRSIGFVFQQFALFPHMTVEENVGVGPRLAGVSPENVAERTRELLGLVGLDHERLRARRPAELSGGQQQRVGLARALALRPRIMLLDEPFGALDPKSRAALQTEYRGLHDRLGLTTLMVTHDMSEALLLADRIAVMAEGRIVRVDSPRELLRSPGGSIVEELLAAPIAQLERTLALRGDP